MNIKKFLLSNNFGIIKKCIKEISSVRKDPNIFNYIDLILSIKDHIYNVNNGNTFYYFSDKKWKELPFQNFISFIEKVLPLFSFYLVSNTDNFKAFEGKIEGITIGLLYQNNNILRIYIKDIIHYNKLIQILKELLWKYYSSDQIIIDVDLSKGNLGEGIFLEIFQDTNKDLIKTALGQKYLEEIKKYREQKLSYSILFHGFPGSGKSNIIKEISNGLNLKTIRFKNIKNMNSFLIKTILELFDPEVFILEDIDHMSIHQMDDLLNHMVEFNKNNKVCLGSCNKDNKLDDALIRPERFDKLVGIYSLDKEVCMNLVENDHELFQIVHTWPAVFIKELMKRIKVEGRDKALLEINDLQDRIDKLYKDYDKQ